MTLISEQRSHTKRIAYIGIEKLAIWVCIYVAHIDKERPTGKKGKYFCLGIYVLPRLFLLHLLYLSEAKICKA